MTALVSCLFIAIISIDCKISNFSLHLFAYFFGSNYNIGELTKSYKQNILVLIRTNL